MQWPNQILQYMGGECNTGHFAYKHFRYATLDSHRSHERKALFPFKIKRKLIFFNSFQNSIIILCFSISFISLLRVYMTNERLWSRRRVARCRKAVLWNILLFWPTFQSDVFGYPDEAFDLCNKLLGGNSKFPFPIPAEVICLWEGKGT